MQKYLFWLCVIVGLSILWYPTSDVSAAQLWTGVAAQTGTQVATLSGWQAVTMYIVNNHPTLAQFVPYSNSTGLVYECEWSSWLHHIANWLVSMLPTMRSQSRWLSVSCAGVPPVVLPPDPPQPQQNICLYEWGWPDRFYFTPIIATGNKANLTYEIQYYHPIYSGGWQTVRFIDNVNTVSYIRDWYGNYSGNNVNLFSWVIDGTLPATGWFSCTTFWNWFWSGGTDCIRTSAFEYSSDVSFLPNTGKNALSGTYPSLWFSDLSRHKDWFAQPIRIRAYSWTLAQDRHTCNPIEEESFWAANHNDARHPSDPNSKWPVKGFHDLWRSVFQVPSVPGEVRIIHDELIQVNTYVNWPNTLMDVIINSGLMIGNTWYELPINNIFPTRDMSTNWLPGDRTNDGDFVCYGSGWSSRWNGQILEVRAYDYDYYDNPNYIGDTFTNWSWIVMSGQIVDSAQPMYLICWYDRLFSSTNNWVLQLPLEFTMIRKRIY